MSFYIFLQMKLFGGRGILLLTWHAMIGAGGVRHDRARGARLHDGVGGARERPHGGRGILRHGEGLALVLDRLWIRIQDTNRRFHVFWSRRWIAI